MAEVIFYASRNLRSDDVIEMVRPWEYDASKAPWGLPKPEYTEHMRNPMTEHRFISLSEGVMPGVRISKENPTHSVAGIIADYDGIVPGEFKTTMNGYLKKAPSGYLPAWASESKSGKAHLIWLFESPIIVSGTDHAKRLVTRVLRKVNADQWGSSMELKSTVDPDVYMDIGKQWVPMAEDYKIPQSVLAMWDVEIFREQIKKNRTAFGAEIPMEDLLAECRARGYKGMPTPFEPGRHCRRFWDPDSDNDRGCIMTEGGVRVFVPHDLPFMTWANIFGRAFVEKYESRKFTAASSDLWWDGVSFWMKENDGVYRTQLLTDLSRKLRCQGLSSAVPKGETASEIDHLLCSVQDTKQVESAECWMYHRSGIMRRENGARILNTSSLCVMQPSAPLFKEEEGWDSPNVKQAFPFIHGLLTHLLGGRIPGQADDDPSQIDRFLWWLSHYYKCAHEYTPEPGQAMFIAGATGTGKSYLSRHVLPTLFGGVAADAGMHLTGGEKWTSQLIGKPFLNIDDDANINAATHARYCQLVKKYVANAEMENQKKFKDTTSVPWCGRILVTCNLDQHSLAIIPDMSRSNKDKITLLMSGASREYRGFGSFAYNRVTVQNELPVFARYLLDLKIPQQYWDPYKRFGVVAWQHPSLTQHIEASDWATSLVENIAMLFGGAEGESVTAARLRKDGCTDEDRLYFIGTSSELFRLLCDNNNVFAREYTSSQAFGRNLQRLSDQGWDCKSLTKPGARTRQWRVARDFIQQGIDTKRASETGGNL